jgi:intraflagellar transport protein 80
MYSNSYNLLDEFLSKKRLSISNDILAVVDSSNNKIIRFFDMSNGKPMNFTVEHTLEVQEIHLNQTDMAGERKVAFVDQNRDLHISPVHKKDIVKLASMTDSFMWHEKYDMLAAISDARLVSWYYPTAVYVDRDLLE